MELQIASDLHLEFTKNFNLVMDKWTCSGDVLILAGDICNFSHFNKFQTFLGKFAKNYDHILYVPGNHEYYNSNYKLILKHQPLLEKHANCSIINNKDIRLGKARFVCSTLWSMVKENASYSINDYNLIDNCKFQYLNEIHLNSVKSIESLLNDKQKGYVIVITHHLPSLNCIDEQYLNNPINSCFASDQSDIIKNYNIHHWIHGHSHSFFQKSFGKKCKTNIIRNPMGYAHNAEANSFNYSFNISLK